MTLPNITVEVGFGSTMFTAAPTWTSLSARVRRAPKITRGRESVDGRFTTGTASLVFANRDGHLSPDNTASPYSPDIKTGVPIRIRHTTPAVNTYDIFYGSARAWPPAYPKSGDSFVTVPLVDGFYTLNLADLAGNEYPAQRTDERITAVLDDIGWPAALRDLDAGVADVQATSFALPNDGYPQPALRHLQRVAESEAGVLFMSGDGKVTFKNRVANSGASTSANFTDSNMSGLVPNYNDDHLYNVIRIAREDGVQVEIDGSGGGPRYVLTRDVMPMANDAQALNVAEWWDAIFGEQKLRIEQIKLKPLRGDASLLDTVLALELRDYINITHTPDQGDALNQDSAVERITHRLVPGDWTTILEVVPLATTETQSYWILGTSQLGSTTRLA